MVQRLPLLLKDFTLSNLVKFLLFFFSIIVLINTSGNVFNSLQLQNQYNQKKQALAQACFSASTLAFIICCLYIYGLKKFCAQKKHSQRLRDQQLFVISTNPQKLKLRPQSYVPLRPQQAYQTGTMVLNENKFLVAVKQFLGLQFQYESSKDIFIDFFIEVIHSAQDSKFIPYYKIQPKKQDPLNQLMICEQIDLNLKKIDYHQRRFIQYAMLIIAMSAFSFLAWLFVAEFYFYFKNQMLLKVSLLVLIHLFQEAVKYRIFINRYEYGFFLRNRALSYCFVAISLYQVANQIALPLLCVYFRGDSNNQSLKQKSVDFLLTLALIQLIIKTSIRILQLLIFFSKSAVTQIYVSQRSKLNFNSIISFSEFSLLNSLARMLFSLCQAFLFVKFNLLVPVVNLAVFFIQIIFISLMTSKQSRSISFQTDFRLSQSLLIVFPLSTLSLLLGELFETINYKNFEMSRELIELIALMLVQIVVWFLVMIFQPLSRLKQYQKFSVQNNEDVIKIDGNLLRDNKIQLKPADEFPIQFETINEMYRTLKNKIDQKIGVIKKCKKLIIRIRQSKLGIKTATQKNKVWQRLKELNELYKVESIQFKLGFQNKQSLAIPYFIHERFTVEFDKLF